MTTAALRPVERPIALVRGALAALSLAGPAALFFTSTIVDAVSALPTTLRACTTGAIVVVLCGLLPWRARLLSMPVVVVLLGLLGPDGATAAMAAVTGIILTALLERGASTFSTTSRALQWSATVLLGLSLLAATLTVLLAASGSWSPLPLSGSAPLLSSSSAASDVAAASCIVVGSGVVIWCATFLMAAGGTPDPTAPPQAWCTSGPYATSSHPMQRGQLLVLLGLTLLVGTQGAAVVALVLAAALLGPVRLLEARQRDARQRDGVAPNL